MPPLKTGFSLIWLFILLAGCSAATPTLEASSQDLAESEELFPHGLLLTLPGHIDEKNEYLPAVKVSSVIIDSARKKHFKPCSGVLIHPRVVITAGHCVCLERPPDSQDGLPSQVPPPRKAAARSTAVTQAEALKGVERITGIIDRKSPCATQTTVTTTVYSSHEGHRGTQTLEYPGTVLVHEQLRMLMGTRKAKRRGSPIPSLENPTEPTLLWNNADLAAIFLQDAVETAFEPLQLAMAEELQVGSRIILVGYGPGSSSHFFGERQYGENIVTRIIMLETGSVLFRTELQNLPTGERASHAEQGDSGGACVSQVNPRVLVGFVTAGAQKGDGSPMSYFTSVYSHRDWLQRVLKRVEKS